MFGELPGSIYNGRSAITIECSSPTVCEPRSETRFVSPAAGSVTAS